MTDHEYDWSPFFRERHPIISQWIAEQELRLWEWEQQSPRLTAWQDDCVLFTAGLILTIMGLGPIGYYLLI